MIRDDEGEEGDCFPGAGGHFENRVAAVVEGVLEVDHVAVQLLSDGDSGREGRGEVGRTHIALSQELENVETEVGGAIPG